jgi:hypothetical protein
MKQLLMLMLCCLVLGHLTAWAQDDPNTIVFHETFDQTNGTNNRTGVNAPIKRSGKAYLTDFSLTAQNRQNSQLQCQFTGNGPLA